MKIIPVTANIEMTCNTQDTINWLMIRACKNQKPDRNCCKNILVMLQAIPILVLELVSMQEVLAVRI